MPHQILVIRPTGKGGNKSALWGVSVMMKPTVFRNKAVELFESWDAYGVWLRGQLRRQREDWLREHGQRWREMGYDASNRGDGGPTDG